MADTFEEVVLRIPFEDGGDPADGVKMVLIKVAQEARRLKGAKLREVVLYFERPVKQGVEHGR